LLLIAVALLALGCLKFDPNANPLAEQDITPDSPEETVRTFFRAMEERNFDLYIQVSDPQYLINPQTGAPIQPTDDAYQTLKAEWEDREAWQADFVAIEVFLNEGESTDTEAVVDVVGGLVQYSGKELFGTSEVKTDNYKEKPGKVFLRLADDPRNIGRKKWVITSGGEPGGPFWPATEAQQ
jgi:hypothetical protein